MAIKRYFIFRVNGIDNCIIDNASDAQKLHEILIEHGYKHIDTELNNLTTTYYFNF